MTDSTNDNASNTGGKAAGANAELRARAAWLYFIEGMTQSQALEKLGVARVMITRLLSEARRRGDGVIRITSPLAPLIELQ